MSIKVNGTEIGSEITLNNTDLSEIKFNGVSVWKSLPAWDTRGLNYNSWDTIQKYIQAGAFSTVASVGQTKSFTINGKTYNAEVVSINDGTGDAAQWYPNGTVDFICEELYESTYVFNSSGGNSGGFPSSQLRNTLNNTLYSLLPSDLTNVIIEKSHLYNVNRSGTMSEDSTKLWPPTYYEIYGTIDSYAAGETSSNNKAYTLASKVKRLNGQNTSFWWLGSMFTNDTTSIWRVDSVIGNKSSGRVDYAVGVPICFRIG